MSAPREVTPAEALPSALVRKAQASGQESCQGQQVARGNSSWGTNLSWPVLGWEGMKQQNWEEWPDPPASGHLLGKAAVKTTSHSTGIFFAFLHLCLNPQEFGPGPGTPCMAQTAPLPLSLEGQHCRSSFLLCMMSDNDALHRLWLFFAPKHKC